MNRKQIISLAITNIVMTTLIVVTLYFTDSEVTSAFWLGFTGFGYLIGSAILVYAYALPPETFKEG